MQVMLYHYPILSELVTMIYQSNNQQSLAGIPTPFKHMNSSVGIMKFPTGWKNKTCSKA